MDEEIDPAAFTDIVMQDAGAEPAELQSLIDVMNPTQLATSLQHMALQYLDLQNAATGIWDTEEDDERGAVRGPPAGRWTVPSGSHGRHTTEPTRDDEEEHTETGHGHQKTQGEQPPPIWQTATADHMERNDDPPRDPKVPRSTPPATQWSTPQPVAQRETEVALAEPARVNIRQQRMPAAKLETFAGQGASVEAFLANFESHATYFGWSERDRVFQLKNSLTGTAAQAL